MQRGTGGRWRTTLAMLACTVASGCAGRAAVAPAATPRGETRAQLLARARVDLGCERASLVELGPRHVAAAGCGAQREYRSVCVGPQGCEWIAIDDLAIRASFELDCPVADIDVVTLGASSRGVVGCGVRATYVLVCQGEGCHWLPSTVHPSAVERHFAPAALAREAPATEPAESTPEPCSHSPVSRIP